ncbi:hypothetical protein BJ165DRAFT_1534503 [Panaeolus papilionaceus]|nr:hypothetical protein BJ165DRAFT_1534503 [Panaeolus papilionaceus]
MSAPAWIDSNVQSGKVVNLDNDRYQYFGILCEVECVFLEHLGVRDLLLWARVCKRAFEGVHVFIFLAWDVSRVLVNMIPPADFWSFRYMQRSSGMVVSGLTALHFFARIPIRKPLLDLYVDRSHISTVVEWFEQRGYGHAKTEKTYGDSRTNIRQRLTRSAYRQSTIRLELYNGEANIRIFGCAASPLAVILGGFPSTALMNFLTYEKAYCMFPKATLDEFISLAVVGPKDDDDMGAVNMIEEQGWSVVWQVGEGATRFPDGPFVTGVRHPGDSMCWTVEFSPIPNASTGWFEKNGFNVVDNDGRLTVDFDEVRSTRQKYGHIVPLGEGVRYRRRKDIMEKGRRELEYDVHHGDS